MYGRFCIKFPQSRMKGERHRPSEHLVLRGANFFYSTKIGMSLVFKKKNLDVRRQKNNYMFQ